jgi:hypothetical protein
MGKTQSKEHYIPEQGRKMSIFETVEAALQRKRERLDEEDKILKEEEYKLSKQKDRANSIITELENRRSQLNVMKIRNEERKKEVEASQMQTQNESKYVIYFPLM